MVLKATRQQRGGLAEYERAVKLFASSDFSAMVHYCAVWRVLQNIRLARVRSEIRSSAVWRKTGKYRNGTCLKRHSNGIFWSFFKALKTDIRPPMV